MELGFIKSKVKLPKVKDKLLERKALFHWLDDVFKFWLAGCGLWEEYFAFFMAA